MNALDAFILALNLFQLLEEVVNDHSDCVDDGDDQRAKSEGAIYGYVTYKDETTKTYALVFSIVFGLLSLIFGCCLWCGWKSLNLAIEMVNVSADFLAQTKRVFAVPFIYNLFMIVFFVFWLTCIVSLYSLGEISADP